MHEFYFLFKPLHILNDFWKKYLSPINFTSCLKGGWFTVVGVDAHHR